MSFRRGSAPNHGRSSRGGWSGRGKYPGTRGGFNTATAPQFTSPDINKNPLGDMLTTIRTSDLEGRHEDAKITDCQYVASYNWLTKTSPTIMIPGKPPAWTPLPEPRQLKEDNSEYFRDINAAMFPSHPTEPALQAVLEADPTFSTSTVDLFACGSTIGNLLRFSKSDPKPFRFCVEVIGDTVCFVRKENEPRELIQDVRGYGHTFPEAYTTWEGATKGSQTHQRIIKYSFGGIKCLVRFGCDGYIKEFASSDLTPLSTANVIPTDDDLVKSLQASTLAQNTYTIGESITITRGGSAVPQQSIFDLKTRSVKRKEFFQLDEFIPQLWVKQIPKFIVGFHTRGVFDEVRVHDVKNDINKWEADHQNDLQRLAALIRKIVDFAHSHDDELLEVYRSEDSAELQIRRQYGKGTDTLSSTTKAAWLRRSGAGGEDAEEEEGADNEDEDDEYSRFSGLPKDHWYEDEGYGGFDYGAESDGSEPDYTACSSEDCGYCGKCSY